MSIYSKHFPIPHLNEENLVKNALLKESMFDALADKAIIPSSISIIESNNVLVVNLDIVYRTRSVINIRRKYRQAIASSRYRKSKNRVKSSINKRNKNNNLKNKRSVRFFRKSLLIAKRTNKRYQRLLELLKVDSVTAAAVKFNVVPLNYSIDADLLLEIEEDFSFYSNKLFPNDFTLYYDFVKCTALLLQGELSVDGYTWFLGIIFRNLKKNKHGIFVNMLDQIVETVVRLIDDDRSTIIGIRIELNGKIRGKDMAEVKKFMGGNIMQTTASASVAKSETTAHTLYGAYGLHIFVSYRSAIYVRKEESKQFIENPTIATTLIEGESELEHDDKESLKFKGGFSKTTVEEANRIIQEIKNVSTRNLRKMQQDFKNLKDTLETCYVKTNDSELQKSINECLDLYKHDVLLKDSIKGFDSVSKKETKKAINENIKNIKQYPKDKKSFKDDRKVNTWKEKNPKHSKYKSPLKDKKDF